MHRRSPVLQSVALSFLIGFLTVSWGAVPALAAPGDLDPSFGDAGLVYTEFYGEAYGMALQTDGKIVTVGGHGLFLAVVRTRSLQRRRRPRSIVRRWRDAEYRVRGRAAVPAIHRGVRCRHPGRRQDRGGRDDGEVIPRATSAATGSRSLATRPMAPSIRPSEPAGRVRTGFGSGHGGAAALGVVIQTDGKIVAAGYARKGFAIVRYNSDGSLDQSFGSGGGSEPRCSMRCMDAPSSTLPSKPTAGSSRWERTPMMMDTTRCSPGSWLMAQPTTRSEPMAR